MLNNVALYTPGQDLGGAFSPERLALAGEMVLVGMGMVFAVLAILWVVLAIFKTVFSKKETGEKTPEPIVTTEPAAPAPEPEAYVAGDEELIAVITAAIAAYRANEEPEAASGGFRVVSFRRANGGRAWNAK